MSNSTWTIEPLFDGKLASVHDAVTNLDAEKVAALTGIASGDPIEIPVRGFLLRAEGRTVLVDTGAGPGGAPALGNLVRALANAGVDAGDVDHVLLTHIHSDHSNGLLDADARPAFPNAELVLHRQEADFWLGDIPAGASARIERNFRGAQRTLGPYRARMRLVEDGDGLPGISALLAAGHTPGHTCWMVETADEPLLIWGDIVHFTRVQVPVPEAQLIYDVDPEAAIASRLAIFDRVATDDLHIAGAHLEGTGFARLHREKGGYRLVHD